MVFQKGNSLGGRPKGSKNAKTLEKERRRAIFDEEITQVWIEKIKELPATYIADQFMGKAPERLEFEGEVKVGGEDIQALAEIAEKLLKEKKL